MPAALVGVVSRNRRRYGGYIVHMGIAVLLIGIAASSSFQTNRDVDLKPGESAVDRRLQRHLPATHRQRRSPRLHRRRGAAVEKDGKTFTLQPDRRFYRPTGELGARRSPTTSAVNRTARSASRRVSCATSGPRSSPSITGVQAAARAADEGFEACVGGGPGAPPQCRAVAAMMRAAAANPRLRPAALGSDRSAAGGDGEADRQALRRRRRARPPSASSSTRSSPGCGSAA